MLRVETERGELRGGETLRARVFGEGPVEWKVYWWAKGEQPSTDHDLVIAKGRGAATPEGLPIEVELPSGAIPSHKGSVVRVIWRLDVWPEGRRVPAPGEPDEEVRVPFTVLAGPTPRRLDAWVEGWRRWQRGERREERVRRAILGMLGLAGAAVLAAVVLAAAFLPPLHAAGALALVGLTVLGAASATGAPLARWLRETRANFRMGVAPAPVAILGGTLDVQARVDANRAMAAGGCTWRLRCVEHAARRVDYTDRGSRRTRHEWRAHVAYEAHGALSGPPYRGRRFTIPIPADAPCTLTAAHRRILWEIEVRCGDDVVIEPIFVAPFAEA